ncbi:hypothetical protein KYY02_14475 [Streptomyces pimonensis]|uniref:Uncharacterized protein n=1 Tax=Streptomyces pimonensis TaxID=2860288 RepID=A0ABV4J331_9ACTN
MALSGGRLGGLIGGLVAWTLMAALAGGHGHARRRWGRTGSLLLSL